MLFMEMTETGRLCHEVEDAADQVRTSIGERTEVLEIMDRFWLLQDYLSRLIDMVDREQGDVRQCRKVMRTVVSSLKSRQVLRNAAIPAVRSACDRINDLLIRLERNTQQADSAGAGS
jgi:hypothetical protein